jgi:cardiolipin synthase
VNWSQLPNLISVGRIVLVGPLAWSLASERYGTTLVLFTIAGVSDALDGFLAKRYGWTSRLGSLLDPLADKLLLVTMFVLMAGFQMLPVWLVALAVLREVVIGEPTPASKVNTFLQIALVIAVLLEHAAFPLPGATVEWLGLAVVASILVSGVQYVWIWSRRARSAAKGRR